MEQEIILEGIYAMLEEIRDNMKKNPEQAMINSKLVAIEKTCNDLAEKKLVTEDLMVGFISYLLKQMIEMNKKQDEKVEKLKECILEHHKHSKEQIITLGQNINIVSVKVEKLLEKEQMNQGFFRRLFNSSK